MSWARLAGTATSHIVNTRSTPHFASGCTVLGLILILVACGGSANRVSVSAAASLTDAFSEIESAYEASNPEVDVVLNLAGSSALREQILEGAPVDVFASADTSNMGRVVEAGAVDEPPESFARNLLMIAVPPGNPARVTGLEDFGAEDRLLGLCAEAVPCGVLARESLAKAGVTPSIDSNEPDVRALLTKIEAGELDAGITYLTDVISAAGAVDGIEIPDEANVAADYQIAVLVDAAEPDRARAFVHYVLSAEGQAILADYGFGSP